MWSIYSLLSSYSVVLLCTNIFIYTWITLLSSNVFNSSSDIQVEKAFLCRDPGNYSHDGGFDKRLFEATQSLACTVHILGGTSCILHKWKAITVILRVGCWWRLTDADQRGSKQTNTPGYLATSSWWPSLIPTVTSCSTALNRSPTWTNFLQTVTPTNRQVIKTTICCRTSTQKLLEYLKSLIMDASVQRLQKRNAKLRYQHAHEKQAWEQCCSSTVVTDGEH